MHPSHSLAKWCSKFSKPGFNSTWTVNFQMFKLDLEKAEEPEIKLSTSFGSSKKQEFYFCFIDNAKAFDYVDNNKLWKILQGMEIPDHLTWLLRNLYIGQELQLEVDMEQQTVSKQEKEYVKAVCCSPSLFNFCAEYVMRHAGLDPRLLGEISVTSDMQIIPPLWKIKWRRTIEPLDERERGEWKRWLKAQHSED